MKQTSQEGSSITLTAAAIATLLNKEDHLVAVNSAGKAVLLSADNPVAIGTFESRLAPDSDDIKVRLLSGGGTVCVYQSAAIAPGVRVCGVNASARVATAAAGDRALGIKILPAGNGAAGDRIEIIPLVEAIPAAPVGG